MTSTRRALALLAGAGAAATTLALAAVPASAASTGYINVQNNCGRSVEVSVYDWRGQRIRGGVVDRDRTAAFTVPAPATYTVAVPAGDRVVTVLSLPDRIHGVGVKAC